MITTDFSKLSDFEINRRVCEALDMEEYFFIPDDEADFDSEIPTDERGPVWQTSKRDINGFRASNGNCFNPCNNPSDAKPIIVENRIGIIPAPENGLWKAAHRKIGNDNTPYHMTQNVNPLRAAMIVFLMMKESESCTINEYIRFFKNLTHVSEKGIDRQSSIAGRYQQIISTMYSKCIGSFFVKRAAFST